MRLAGEDDADHFSGRRAHGFTPVNQPRRGPLQVRLMALGHVLMNGGVPISRRAAGMATDSLAVVEQFDRGCRVAGLQLLARELIGNAVVMAVDLDVIVDLARTVFHSAIE